MRYSERGYGYSKKPAHLAVQSYWTIEGVLSKIGSYLVQCLQPILSYSKPKTGGQKR